MGGAPVKACLAGSLNQPGGNATGVSDFINQLVQKRLEFIHSAVPTANLIALLVNPGNPNSEPDIKETETAAGALGLKLLVVRATTDRELETPFGALDTEQGCVPSLNTH